MKTNRKWIALAAAAVLPVIAVTVEAVAEPGVPAPVAVDPDSARDAVTETSEALTAHWKDAGYGKVAVDYDAMSVTVYWKGGKAPAAVEAMTGDQPNGVHVTVVPSKYSEKDLLDAGRRIMDGARTSEPGSVVTVGARPDLSAVVATLKDSSRLAKDQGKARTQLESLSSGVPVDIAVAAQPIAQINRQNDSAPWQGGGALAYSDGNNYCSVGFSVLRSDGTGRLLSASHCNDNVGAVVRDGVGDRIGVISNVVRGTYDSILIDPDASPATVGKVFGGPWNASTTNNRYQFSVGGSAAPAEGETVCTSGAMSGEHCNRVIRETSINFSCGPNGNYTCQGFRSSGSGVTVAAGDSGGPLYVMRSDGRVGARGILTSASGSISCPAGSTAEPTDCYTSVYSVGIHRLVDYWNLTVEED